MKRLLLSLTILVAAGAVLFAVNQTSNRWQQQFQADQNTWSVQSRQLDEAQAERAALTTKVRELQRDVRSGAASTLDPAMMELLLTNGAKSASPEMLDKLLTSFGRGGNSSNGYVLISKAALKGTALRPLKTFPNAEKLSDNVREILAVTPAEEQSVETALAETYAATAAWAKANLQHDGPSGDMLVRYTLPAEPAVELAATEKLFSTFNSVLGDERGSFLRNFYQSYRPYEDGFLGARTNIFEIHRISNPPGLGYRAGQRWSESKWSTSETINTYPEPIKPDRFPAAFRFVFPGGWKEVAQQEGFTLPDGF